MESLPVIMPTQLVVSGAQREGKACEKASPGTPRTSAGHCRGPGPPGGAEPSGAGVGAGSPEPGPAVAPGLGRDSEHRHGGASPGQWTEPADRTGKTWPCPPGVLGRLALPPLCPPSPGPRTLALELRSQGSGQSAPATHITSTCHSATPLPSPSPTCRWAWQCYWPGLGWGLLPRGSDWGPSPVGGVPLASPRWARWGSCWGGLQLAWPGA